MPSPIREYRADKKAIEVGYLKQIFSRVSKRFANEIRLITSLAKRAKRWDDPPKPGEIEEFAGIIFPSAAALLGKYPQSFEKNGEADVMRAAIRTLVGDLLKALPPKLGARLIPLQRILLDEKTYSDKKIFYSQYLDRINK
jgi:hypothetical protein